MDFFDFIVEYPNVLSKDKCDEIIERFEADDRKHPGALGAAKVVNTDIKDSMDLMVSIHDDWSDIDSLFHDIVSKGTSWYSSFMAHVGGPYEYCADPEFGDDYIPFFSLSDTGYQIQKTVPGGKYSVHDDGCVEVLGETHMHFGHEYFLYKERLYTFILYLNDRKGIGDGRTVFYFAGKEHYVEAEAGKLLFFPANAMFRHAGEPLKNGVKYLMTGWISNLDGSRVN